mmetsp:Transcript_30504/g.68882  ORF Transcript_30504/g.68882 Transcript_30504/m.68882 type:complete len:202 (-) Transcript_30504:1269-1874(-)
MPTHQPLLRVLHHTAVPIPIKNPLKALHKIFRRVPHVQAVAKKMGEFEAQKIVDAQAESGGHGLPTPGNAGSGAVDAGDGVTSEREGASVLVQRIRPETVLRSTKSSHAKSIPHSKIKSCNGHDRSQRFWRNHLDRPRLPHDLSILWASLCVLINVPLDALVAVLEFRPLPCQRRRAVRGILHLDIPWRRRRQSHGKIQKI